VIQGPQIAQADGEFRIVGFEGFFVQIDGSTEKRFGFVVLSLDVVEEGEFREGLRQAVILFANLLNNLALLHFNQDSYDKAEPLMQRALAINEKELGEEHPTVARTLKNYAALLRQTNRATQADELDARAKAIQKKQEQSRDNVKRES